jgi:hypothetical protein
MLSIEHHQIGVGSNTNPPFVLHCRHAPLKPLCRQQRHFAQGIHQR